ncbi:site-2 protease family protein [Brevundimonas sp.]|jgi:Zn-dependent protease|uniref:metalloprotease n=1 Tax=Brevundimonas sp. TaxID=1871086 RepID=UPI00260C7781|nr:site-2 protease family protein [Brevundimonas sp.]
MTDAPRRPGPWDPKPETPPVPGVSAATPGATPGTMPLDKGQNPVWAVISTLLLGGFVWWITGSWVIAVALVFGLFVHEYGHVLAMNRLGMGPARIYIIPFLGGLAKAQRGPRSEWDGVLVSLAGPAFGLLAAGPFFVGYFVQGSPAWLAGAFAIALINLVNLAPAPPLDGSKALGPVLARIHPALEWTTMLAIGAAVIAWGVTNGSFLFAAFLAIALIGHLRRGRWRPDGRRLSWPEAAASTALFLVTAAACVVVGVAALLPLGDGSPIEGLRQGGRMLGLSS